MLGFGLNFSYFSFIPRIYTNKSLMSKLEINLEILLNNNLPTYDELLELDSKNIIEEFIICYKSGKFYTDQLDKEIFEKFNGNLIIKIRD